MKKPRLNAYRRVWMTDGVQRWTRYEFDSAVKWTKDDCEKFMQALSAQAPQTRIAVMQARLTELKSVAPTVQFHIDAIRKIHAEFLAINPPTLESLEALDRQNEHWLRIQLIQSVLPAARESVAKKAKRKAVNAANAKAARPNARTVDHDEIAAEFKRLLKIGHTAREARGLLFARGLASRSTIFRATKRKVFTSAG
jgi:hypothetical protein